MNEPVISYLFSANGYVICFVLFIISLPNINSWDLAVANEGAINFLDLDGRKIQSSPEIIGDLNDFYVLTYDSSKERIFFSVNNSIFEFDLRKKILNTLVSNQTFSVQGISHYGPKEALYWTDGNGHHIWKRSLANDSADSAEIVLTLEREIPMGIAISFCKRLLFWANGNHRSPSIDRSDLDGGNHEILISKDIFLPLAIAVDEGYRKLYWTDDEEGIYFKIERSNFDGTGRELVIQRTNQEPFGIATAKNSIYWTDTLQRNVWTISFSNESISEPELLYKFKKFSPYGIVAFREGSVDCDTKWTTSAVPAKENVSRRIPAAKSEPRCPYQPGTRTGNGWKHCETSECHNYCLNGGQCLLDGKGFAECRCLPGYVGSRCERDTCSGFCLNGGRCSINDSFPVCSCGAGYTGQQCETSLDVICDGICSKTVIRDCNSTSPKYALSMNYDMSIESSQCRFQRFFTIFLISSEALTMLVVVVLARRIFLLRRSPRIKKRIIVNKGVRGQTPMTARPQTTVSEQCEITIENCCNMNICETPCFEPNLLSARSSSASLQQQQHQKQKRISEDKKKLLKNMEEDLMEGSDLSRS